MPEDREGTGKHPHKSTEEPYPHTKDNRKSEQGGRQEAQHRGGESHSSREGSGNQSSRSENADLKEREYRDNQGNVHHHTHTYEEEHGKEKK